MMAAATASPWAAQAAEAGSGTGGLLLAVGVGAAVALAAVAVVLRSRDRGAVEPPREALAAACAFWWRTDPSGRIVEIEFATRGGLNDAAVRLGDAGGGVECRQFDDSDSRCFSRSTDSVF
jgi:hypothetical protein